MSKHYDKEDGKRIVIQKVKETENQIKITKNN